MAEPGDATWLHTFYDSELWDSAGGDFSADASATQTIAGDATYTWDSVDTTQDNATLISDVQSWLDNPEANFGWILTDNVDTPATSARRLNSRENPDDPPQLRVSFTTPPSAIVFQNDFESAAKTATCPGS